MSIRFPYTITTPTDQEANAINDKIDDFNGKQISFTGNIEVFKNYVIKHNNEIIAGIRSVFYLGTCLAINVLFVEEKHRHQGLGSALLQKVENEAKNMGAQIAHLDTFDFQAKDFYLKHGYEIFGVLENCPKGHSRYYLRKLFSFERL